MKVIYTKIAADLFHHGHVNFLKEASSRGDKLIVHVVNDERVAAYKGRPIMTQDERIAVVEACRFVDEVIRDGPKEITKAFLDQNGYTSYAFGFANDVERKAKLSDCKDLPSEMVEIIEYTPDISSTILKKRIKSQQLKSKRRITYKLFNYSILMILMILLSIAVDRGIGLFLPIESEQSSGILFQPNTTIYLETDEFSYTVVTNGIGLRSPEIELQKPDSTYRILVIGDSWTMGYGVENDEAWPQQLQSILTESESLSIEVINAGVSGADPQDYLRILDETIALLNPDLTLVGVLQVNDLSDLLLKDPLQELSNSTFSWTSVASRITRELWPNSLNLMTQVQTSRGEVDLRGLWKSNSLRQINSFDAFESVRYQLLSEDIRSMFESGNLNPQLLRLYIRFPERPFVFNDRDNVYAHQILKRMTDIIQSMKMRSLDHGSEFAVIHLPMNYYTGHQVKRNTFDQLTPYLTEMNHIDEILKNELDSLEIPSVFLTKAFEQSNSSEPLFYKFDGHPTPAGHRIIAQQLSNWSFLKDKISTYQD